VAFLSDGGEPGGRDDWLGVEVRHLAAMSAIAKEGSFRAAAERLGYVQSSISQQIAQLERLVGHRLIERSRGGGGVALTEAGERLLDHSQVILSRFRAARVDLASLSEGVSSTVRVAMCQSIATRLMPRILPVYAQAWPQVTVATSELASEADIFGIVHDGVVDLGFVDLPLEPGPFESAALMRDPVVLVVPRGSPLAQLERSPTWAEIARVPLVGHKRARFLSRVENQMRAQGFEPRFVYRSDIDAAVQAMVGSAGSAAVVTRLIADAAHERTTLVDLSKLISPRILAIIWHGDRNLSPPVAGFRQATVAVCEQLRGTVAALALQGGELERRVFRERAMEAPQR
jgi:molybdate transport repressor ModE-like protein